MKERKEEGKEGERKERERKKRQDRLGENICRRHWTHGYVEDKWLLFKIYLQILKLHNKKTNNLI